MGERLVFVTIKDGPTLPSGRPLRRAVVPIDSTTSWETFQGVVMKKLRVAQIGSFYTKQGQKIGTMSDVMTVDDLEVEEVKAEVTAPVTPHRRHLSMEDMGLVSPGGSARRHRHTAAASGGGGATSINGTHHHESTSVDLDENSKKKAGRTGTQINLLLQKVGLKTSPGLPVTMGDTMSGEGNHLKRGNSALRKSRKGPMSMGAGRGGKKGRGVNLSTVVSIIMVVCFFCMIALYYNISQSSQLNTNNLSGGNQFGRVAGGGGGGGGGGIPVPGSVPMGTNHVGPNAPHS